jgi:hypothetical protein
MNVNIMSAALATKFAKEQIEAVLDVVIATPNAEIAVEKLLGVYVFPVVAQMGKYINSKEEASIYKMESFDEWQQTVYYSYEELDTKSVWVLKEKENQVTWDNLYQLEVSSREREANPEAHVLVKLEGEVRTRKSSCTLHQWEQYAHCYTESNNDELL